MRRLVLAVSVALAMGGSAAVAGAAAAAPGPVRRDDNATVCLTTATTVSKGLEGFVTDMEQVGSLAHQGDLVRAEDSVRDAGIKLVGLSRQLHKDAQAAEDAPLKTAVGDLAAEFDHLGRSLDDLASLQTFDTTRLDELAQKMSSLCGGRRGPVPSPSATPGRRGPPTASATD